MWRADRSAWTDDRINSRESQCNRYGSHALCPMHEEVRSNFHTRLLSSLRLSSVAGRGLPERMRSTAFLFLGLTAAAGLALVAIFAQMSFPLLSPAPLPRDPSRATAVAEAEVVATSPGLSPSVPARPPRGSGVHDVPGQEGRRRFAQAEPGTAKAAPVVSPQPASSGVDRGGVTAEPVETTAPSAAPVPVESPPPAPSPAPAAAPVAEPAPVEPPKPEVRPASSKPPKPEAKTAKVKPEAKPAPVPSYEPAPAPPPASVDKEKGKHEK